MPVLALSGPDTWITSGVSSNSEELVHANCITYWNYLFPQSMSTTLRRRQYVVILRSCEGTRLLNKTRRSGRDGRTGCFHCHSEGKEYCHSGGKS